MVLVKGLTLFCTLLMLTNAIPSSLGHPNGKREKVGPPLTAEDFERGHHLPAKLLPTNNTALYRGGNFEGDIVETSRDNSSSNGTAANNAVRHANLHWPNGEVIYALSATFNQEQRAVIARAIEEYHKHTCIRFKAYTGSERNYTALDGGSGCSSNVGMIGGRQKLTLGQGCFTVSTVVHEMMHTLGFYHEQSRTDRDDFVKIIYDNILPDMAHNFQKYSVELISDLDEPYDYKSILHYDAYAFSKDGRSKTIEAYDHEAEIGQRNGFSRIDIDKINKLYRCKDNGNSSGYDDKDEDQDKDQDEDQEEDQDEQSDEESSDGYGRSDRWTNSRLDRRPNYDSYDEPDPRFDFGYEPGLGGSSSDDKSNGRPWFRSDHRQPWKQDSRPDLTELESRSRERSSENPSKRQRRLSWNIFRKI